MPLRDITLDDIESLAVGAWVLGTGGGGSPYLGAAEHARPLQGGPSRAAHAGGGARRRRLGGRRVQHGRAAGRAGAADRQPHHRPRGRADGGATSAREFRGIMSLEIGGGNSIQPLMAAAHLKRPVIDSDMMGRAYPEAQMTSSRSAISSRARSPRSMCAASNRSSRACRPGNGWSGSAARSASSTARSPRPARRRAPAPR